jgi:outer membrane biogenesis lipoprotein LolB
LARSWFRLALVVLLFVSGCAKKEIRPVDEAVKKDASLEELLTLYQLRRQEWIGFKGLLEITADSKRQGRHTFQASWVHRNGETRIRGFNLVGGTLFELRLAGSSVTLHLPSERRTIEATREEFEEEVQAAVPVGSLALIDWVNRGGLPDPAPPSLPALEKGKERFILYLIRALPGKAVLEEKIRIERTAFRVEGVERFDAGGVQRGRLIFDDYRKAGQHDFPFEVRGESEEEKVTLRFREVTPIAP